MENSSKMTGIYIAPRNVTATEMLQFMATMYIYIAAHQPKLCSCALLNCSVSRGHNLL